MMEVGFDKEEICVFVAVMKMIFWFGVRCWCCWWMSCWLAVVFDDICMHDKTNKKVNKVK